MIVLDASAVVDLLLRMEPFASQVRAEVVRNTPNLAAPHLLDVEVAQVLRRFVLAGAVDLARAEAALVDLGGLPLIRYPHGPLLGRAFTMRAQITVYDAVYLALAEALEAPLVTRDSALCRVSCHDAVVRLIS